MGDLIPGKVYVVSPSLRIKKYMPMVRLLYVQFNKVALVKLRDGRMEQLHTAWLVEEATPLLEVLF